MTLWFCRFRGEEWGCYVLAPTIGRAKSLFWEAWRDEGDYTDIRISKIKDADGYPDGVHDTDDSTLAELGVRFYTEEELWEST